MPARRARPWDGSPDLLPPTETVASALLVVLGVWLVLAPWLLAFGDAGPTVAETAAGALVALAAVLELRHAVPARPACACAAAAGLWLVLAGALLSRSATVRLDELLMGALVVLLAAVGAPVRRPADRRRRAAPPGRGPTA